MIEDRFGEMWRRSREDADVSQDHIAHLLGVSKRTVQNWEAGYSSPSQIMGFKWFEALGLQPLPYYLALLYPEEFTGIKAQDPDKRIEEALVHVVRDLSPDMQRKLLYVLFGDHGSSPVSLLDMIVAHLHVPLRSRLNIAQAVLQNYEIAEALGEIHPHIKPNCENLHRSIKNAAESVKQRKQSYTNTMEG